MEPQKTPNATETVIERLGAFIKNECKPGDRIPSESDLMARHGVSRITIREAIKVLCGQGLLSVSQGRRATVQEPSSERLGDYLFSVLRNDMKGQFDLLEVRQTLEVQSAGLAARNAPSSGILAISHEIDGMQRCVEQLEAESYNSAAETQFHQHDAAFHAAIAWCSGNRLLAHMLEAMGKSLTSAFRLSAQGRKKRGLDFRATIAAHIEIYEAIEGKSPLRATRAMTAHLEDAKNDLMTALG